MKVDTAGNNVPIWFVSPVDPAQRWVAADQQATADHTTPHPVLALLLERTDGAAATQLPVLVSLASSEIGSDDALTGQVLSQLDTATAGVDRSWFPPPGTKLSFVPADVVFQVQ